MAQTFRLETGFSYPQSSQDKILDNPDQFPAFNEAYSEIQEDKKGQYVTTIDDIGSAKNTNLPTAIFTTAYSRVMLHRIMEKVGYENVLMTDTDSCIFKYKTNDRRKIYY